LCEGALIFALLIFYPFAVRCWLQIRHDHCIGLQPLYAQFQKSGLCKRLAHHRGPGTRGGAGARVRGRWSRLNHDAASPTTIAEFRAPRRNQKPRSCERTRHTQAGIVARCCPAWRESDSRQFTAAVCAGKVTAGDWSAGPINTADGKTGAAYVTR
jgi:hypothetical protein